MCSAARWSLGGSASVQRMTNELRLPSMLRQTESEQRARTRLWLRDLLLFFWAGAFSLWRSMPC